MLVYVDYLDEDITVVLLFLILKFNFEKASGLFIINEYDNLVLTFKPLKNTKIVHV